MSANVCLYPARFKIYVWLKGANRESTREYCTPNLDLTLVGCRSLSTHLSQHHNPIILWKKTLQVNS
ncbi:hypothetical protein NC653_037849 [Populus alba x Populus x berolinensis]|uniref:Uncharacterized protein n=1 Tax=Populus alba x Populus x berolinensis TaxID=444605 RepID=A0AAD6LF64_9ROSI|nr:hypothetical protein NC653_037849 [Populus alba x Populus x berolinensis]